MKNIILIVRYQLFLTGVFLMLLSGCARTLPAQFYVLSPLPVAAQEESVPKNATCFRLGIGPVEIPEYLDRTQIVTRKSEHELELSEFNKWAEPLQDNISRVLTENLTSLLHADAFTVHPWRGAHSIDYRLTLEVIRFDGALTETVSLVARWSIFGNGGKKLLRKKTSTYTEPVESPDYETLVTAQSSVLASLSREIAAEIRAISKNTAGQ